MTELKAENKVLINGIEIGTQSTILTNAERASLISFASDINARPEIALNINTKNQVILAISEDVAKDLPVFKFGGRYVLNVKYDENKKPISVVSKNGEVSMQVNSEDGKEYTLTVGANGATIFFGDKKYEYHPKDENGNPKILHAKISDKCFERMIDNNDDYFATPKKSELAPYLVKLYMDSKNQNTENSEIQSGISFSENSVGNNDASFLSINLNQNETSNSVVQFVKMDNKNFLLHNGILKPINNFHCIMIDGKPNIVVGNETSKSATYYRFELPENTTDAQANELSNKLSNFAGNFSTLSSSKGKVDKFGLIFEQTDSTIKAEVISNIKEGTFRYEESALQQEAQVVSGDNGIIPNYENENNSNNNLNDTLNSDNLETDKTPQEVDAEIVDEDKNLTNENSENKEENVSSTPPVSDNDDIVDGDSGDGNSGSGSGDDTPPKQTDRKIEEPQSYLNLQQHTPKQHITTKREKFTETPAKVAMYLGAFLILGALLIAITAPVLSAMLVTLGFATVAFSGIWQLNYDRFNDPANLIRHDYIDPLNAQQRELENEMNNYWARESDIEKLTAEEADFIFNNLFSDEAINDDFVMQLDIIFKQGFTCAGIDNIKDFFAESNLELRQEMLGKLRYFSNKEGEITDIEKDLFMTEYFINNVGLKPDANSFFELFNKDENGEIKISSSLDKISKLNGMQVEIKNLNKEQEHAILNGSDKLLFATLANPNLTQAQRGKLAQKYSTTMAQHFVFSENLTQADIQKFISKYPELEQGNIKETLVKAIELIENSEGKLRSQLTDYKNDTKAWESSKNTYDSFLTILDNISQSVSKDIKYTNQNDIIALEREQDAYFASMERYLAIGKNLSELSGLNDTEYRAIRDNIYGIKIDNYVKQKMIDAIKTRDDLLAETDFFDALHFANNHNTTKLEDLVNVYGVPNAILDSNVSLENNVESYIRQEIISMTNDGNEKETLAELDTTTLIEQVKTSIYDNYCEITGLNMLENSSKAKTKKAFDIIKDHNLTIEDIKYICEYKQAESDRKVSKASLDETKDEIEMDKKEFASFITSKGLNGTQDIANIYNCFNNPEGQKILVKNANLNDVQIREANKDISAIKNITKLEKINVANGAVKTVTNNAIKDALSIDDKNSKLIESIIDSQVKDIMDNPITSLTAIKGNRIEKVEDSKEFADLKKFILSNYKDDLNLDNLSKTKREDVLNRAAKMAFVKTLGDVSKLNSENIMQAIKVISNNNLEVMAEYKVLHDVYETIASQQTENNKNIEVADETDLTKSIDALKKQNEEFVEAIQYIAGETANKDNGKMIWDGNKTRVSLSDKQKEVLNKLNFVEMLLTEDNTLDYSKDLNYSDIFNRIIETMDSLNIIEPDKEGNGGTSMLDMLKKDLAQQGIKDGDNLQEILSDPSKVPYGKVLRFFDKNKDLALKNILEEAMKVLPPELVSKNKKQIEKKGEITNGNLLNSIDEKIEETKTDIASKASTKIKETVDGIENKTIKKVAEKVTSPITERLDERIDPNNKNLTGVEIKQKRLKSQKVNQKLSAEKTLNFLKSLYEKDLDETSESEKAEIEAEIKKFTNENTELFESCGFDKVLPKKFVNLANWEKTLNKNLAKQVEKVGDKIKTNTAKVYKNPYAKNKQNLNRLRKKNLNTAKEALEKSTTNKYDKLKEKTTSLSDVKLYETTSTKTATKETSEEKS